MTTIYSKIHSDADAQRHNSVHVLEPPLPVDEPLKVMDVREHLRIDPASGPSQDDSWIEAMIPAVREWCEGWLERSLAPQTLELTGNEFPHGAIALPYGPVINVLSVTAGGAVFSDYTLSRAGVIHGAWPSVTPNFGAVSVVYRAGYGFTSSPFSTLLLPASITAAMKLLMGHFYENREASTALKLENIPMGVVSLLQPYRQRTSIA